MAARGIRPGGELVCWRPGWPPNHWTVGEFRRGVQFPRGVVIVSTQPEVLGESEQPEPEPPAVSEESDGDEIPDMVAGDSLCDPRIFAPVCFGVPGGLDWVQGDVAGGPYVALDSGWTETCGLRRDGTADCWGMAPGSPPGSFTAIDGIGLGIRPDGEVVRWDHRNPDGLGPWTDLVAPPGRRFVALDHGLFDVCGLLDDGALLCTSYTPDIEDRSGPFTRFSVGGGGIARRGGSSDGLSEQSVHVCAIRTDGDLECWGTNNSGQTTLAPWLDIAPYRDVAAGFVHTCAVGAAGEVLCWGDDRYGQTQSPPGTFTALSAGFWHTCGLRPDGEIDCWGNGAGGLALTYGAVPPDRPAEPPAGPFTAVAAGAWHTCALRADGTATCWLSY